MINEVKRLIKQASVYMTEDEFSVLQKGNNSNYVTSADLNVQKFLYKELRKIIPESGFVGEEEDTVEISNGYIWIVDPIDGTSNFIRDIGISSISVALYKNGKPVLGVIYYPVRDEMYYAEAGKGAFMNEKQIYVSDRDFAHSHLCSAMSLYDKSLAKPCFNIIERVYEKSDDLRRLGSAATELAYLAAGRVELYFEIKVQPWDAAAAILMIREAGGYTECLYEDEMPLDKPFSIIAANTKENFEILRKIVYEEITKKIL